MGGWRSKIRHEMSWAFLIAAIEFGLVDTDDDCPKPKEYGGLEELSKLLIEHTRGTRAEVVRLRKVTGPDCPVCRSFLRSQHQRFVDFRGKGASFVKTHRPAGITTAEDFCITVADLIANHPEIAR